MFLAAGAAADDVRQIALPTNDLLYDRFTQRIYASIPGSVPAIGNTITAIDPVTGSLGPSVFIGSQPGRLAISDGGEYLYAGLDGSGSVRRRENRQGFDSSSAAAPQPANATPYAAP